jgi:MFS transporter, OPA family, sugar phosphate sensor protein UhpC
MDKRLRWGLIVLVCMYLGYMSLMVCRNTLIVASPAMIADQSLDLDKAGYGRLMAFHSMGGVVGKVISGFAVDRWGGRFIFLTVIMLTAGTTALFGLLNQFSLMAGLNLTGQAAKAGGWPAMAALIRTWYPPEQHGRVWGVISTSSRVGVMVATLFLGQLLVWNVPWRHLFYVSFGVGVLMFLVGFFFLKSGPEKVGLSPLTVAPDIQDEEVPLHPLDGHTTKEAARRFWGSKRVWLISITMALTTILMDFLNFIPVYLAESLKLDSGVAGKAATAFPAGCFVAVLGAGFLYDKLSKKNRVFGIGGMLVSGVISLGILWALPGLGLNAGESYYVAVFCVFLFGLAIAPAYYIPMSVFSISYGGPHCGFLICLLDMFGYAGATVFNYFGGSLAQVYGWGAFLATLIAITLTSTITMVTFLHLEAKS